MAWQPDDCVGAGSGYDFLDEFVWEVALSEYAGDEVGIELVVHCGNDLDVVIGLPVTLKVSDQVAADFGDNASPCLPVANPFEKLVFTGVQLGKCVIQVDLAPGPVFQFPLVGLAGKEPVESRVGNKGWLMEPVDQEAVDDVRLVSETIEPAGDSTDASYMAECE